MSLAADIADDYLLFDGVETIQYYSRTDEVTWATPITAQALKRMNVKNWLEGQDQDVIRSNNAPWELWRSSMSSPVIPRQGDKFTVTVEGFGAQTWLVDSVDYATLLTRYRLQCHLQGFGS